MFAHTYIHAYTLSGTLAFVNLDSYTTGTIPRGNDTYATVSVVDGLHFGNTVVFSVNVRQILLRILQKCHQNASGVVCYNWTAYCSQHLYVHSSKFWLGMSLASIPGFPLYMV